MVSNEVGIVDKKVTNHSVQKTIQLMDAEFTPNEVAQLSGHKNVKSLDSYMTASETNVTIPQVQAPSLHVESHTPSFLVHPDCFRMQSCPGAHSEQCNNWTKLSTTYQKKSYD